LFLGRLLRKPRIAQTVIFAGIAKNYLSESAAAAFALLINVEPPPFSGEPYANVICRNSWQFRPVYGSPAGSLMLLIKNQRAL
jgi:hypothetical protein